VIGVSARQADLTIAAEFFYDDDLKRVYVALLRRRGHAKAKVAVARRLLVQLFIMLRDRIDFTPQRERPLELDSA
jgi:hypothetical protein